MLIGRTLSFSLPVYCQKNNNLIFQVGNIAKAVGLSRNIDLQPEVLHNQPVAVQLKCRSLAIVGEAAELLVQTQI